MWPLLSQEVIFEATQDAHEVGDTAPITGVLLTRPDALGYTGCTSSPGTAARVWTTARAYDSCPTKYRACPRLGLGAQSWGSCGDRLQERERTLCTNALPWGLCPKGSVQGMGLSPSQEGPPGRPCKVQPLKFLGGKGHRVDIPHRNGLQRKWTERNQEALV